MPLGVGLALVRFGRAGWARIVLEASALGFGFATLVETLQIFEPARCPQLADVWRNGVGCVIGAVVAACVLRAVARGDSVSEYAR
jgi:VanZ family protein